MQRINDGRGLEQTIVEGVDYRIRRTTLQALEGLQTLLADVGLDELTSRTREIREDLESDRFRIIVCGRFKTGKSTFLNAILGTPEDGGPDIGTDGVLPSHRNPTTAVLTDITYAPRLSVRVVRSDMSSEDWTINQFKTESKVRTREQDTIEFFSNIRQFELGYPCSLLRNAKIMITDSPGASDVAHRDLITREAVGHSDAAIFLLRSDQLAGEDERKFLKEIRETGCRTFVVVNLWGGDRADRELIDFTWDRLVVGEKICSPGTPQDFPGQGIYFVDARKALRGKWEHLNADLDDSGLIEFEQALGAFLDRGRIRAHAEKYLREAERVGVVARQKLLLQERDLRMAARDLDQIISQTRPRLATVKGQRDILKLTFDKYERGCQNTAEMALRRFLDGFRKELPAKLKACKLRSLAGTGVITAAVSSEARKQIAEEILGHASRILEDEFKSWSNPKNPDGLPRALQPEMENLGRELNEQIERMSDELGAIAGSGIGENLQMGSGIRADLNAIVRERIETVAFSRFGTGAMVGGALAGTMIATIGAQVAVSITTTVLATVGVMLNPWLVLGGLVTAFVGLGAALSGIGVEGRVKDVAAEKLGAEIALDRTLPSELRAAVSKAYRQFTDPIQDVVDSQIRTEEQALDQRIQSHQKSRDEKDERLLQLQDLGAALGDVERLLLMARNDLAQV